MNSTPQSPPPQRTNWPQILIIFALAIAVVIGALFLLALVALLGFGYFAMHAAQSTGGSWNASHSRYHSSTFSRATFVNGAVLPYRPWAATPVDPVLYTKSPRIRVWKDRSGLGNDLLAQDIDTAPNIHPDALNGHTVIAFPTVGQILHTARPFGVDGDADRTLITVQRYLVVNTGDDTTNHAFGIDYAASLGIFYLPYQYANDLIVSREPSILHNWNVSAAEHASSVTSGYVDGLKLNESTPLPTDTTVIPLTVGTRTPGDGLSRSGEIAEIVYYHRALSSNERTMLTAYLACKWGLRGALTTQDPDLQSCPPERFSPKSIPGLDGWWDASATGAVETGPARRP